MDRSGDMHSQQRRTFDVQEGRKVAARHGERRQAEREAPRLKKKAKVVIWDPGLSLERTSG